MMFRFKALSEVIPACGLYPAPWHLKASAQIAGRDRDVVMDGGIESNIIPIMRFASTLHRDIDAVRNAIELPWNNGQVEGQVNRPKTLKRAMYGRAGPELLRAACCPSATEIEADLIKRTVTHVMTHGSDGYRCNIGLADCCMHIARCDGIAKTVHLA